MADPDPASLATTWTKGSDCYKERGPALPGEESRREGQEGPVGPREAGPGCFATQDLELVTEDQDFDILVEGALAPDTEHLKSPARE